MDPHSFLKPTFYLGLGDWTVSNLETMGAHDRTPGHITLMSNGAVGFQTPGDRMCLKVQVSRCSMHAMARQDVMCVIHMLNVCYNQNATRPGEWSYSMFSVQPHLLPCRRGKWF